MAEWYYVKNDQQCGPVSREKLVQLLAAGQIARDDLVWTDTMDDWIPARQVPGLTATKVAAPPQAKPGGSSAARAAAPVVASAKAEPAEDQPASGGFASFWTDLSRGMKIGILAGGSSGIVLLMVALVLVVSHIAGQHPAADAPKRPAADSTAQTPVKKAPTPEPIRPVIDFDPKSISTAEQREEYDKGVKHGGRLAEEYADLVASTKPEKDKILFDIKGMIEERNVSVQAAVDTWGKTDPRTMMWFGTRDGLKAGLKKHQFSVP